MVQSIPLSPFQSVFYFEWKLNPQRTDYHMVIDQNIEGEINYKKLNNCLKNMIKDIFIFNAHVVEINEKFYWKKNNEVLDLEYFDKNINSEIKIFLQREFNLESGPLYRYGLFKIDENKYRLIYILHHAIIDGASAEQFYTEVSKYYNLNNYRYPISIDDQKNKIIEFSLKLENEIKKYYNICYDFWMSKIENYDVLNTEFLIENIDFNKNDRVELTNQKIFGINEIYFSITGEYFDKLSAIRKKFAITNYLFSKIVYAITLYKYTNQNNFIIAYPISIKEGIELFYGANVNINFIPFNINGEKTIKELILETKIFLKSLKNEEYRLNYFPMYNVFSKKSNKFSSIGFSSAFLQQTSFNFNNLNVQPTKNSNIALTHDFAFEVQQFSNEIKFRINYKNKKISKQLIENLCKNYKNIFNQIIDFMFNKRDELCKLKINQLHLLDKCEEKKVIYDWNKKYEKKFKYKKPIEYLENHAVKFPKNNALHFNGKNMSYSELNNKANILSNYLIDKFNVHKGDYVGLLMERSEHLIIAILSVLKSGAVYVPIDPEYPFDRIKFIIDDTKLNILLMNNNIRITKKNKNKINFNLLNILIFNDEFLDKNNINKYRNNPNINAGKKDISYLIYTSGTTGKPKGVLIKNESVSNLIEFQKNNLKNEFFNKKIKVLFFSSFVFDAHVWELISGLLLGNQLYLVDEETRQDYNLLAKFIDDNGINLAVLPPVILNKERPLNLDVLFVAGDKTNSLIVKEYLKENKVIYNAYGPTENTVMCFMHKYTNFLEANCIGSLVYNHKAYILDDSLQPLPDGAIGELYLTGVGLCAGYLNRDSLNQVKFLKNPFQNQNEIKHNINSKIYKTGDLVRRLSNGKIEYIGRNDFQVKISGVRIELEEIENTILSIKGIKKVYILAKELDTSSLNYNKTIICYYVSDKSIKDNQIIEYLQKVLPHFMIPKFYINLDKFPLNNNGKIDIKLLPNPEIKESLNIVTPRNSIEQKLCSIWAEILGLNISFIGIHSDFFSLGGDSIKAIQAVSRIRSSYKLTLNVKDILKLKTIENISKYIELLLNKQSSLNYLSNIEAASGEYPLLPIQKWFFANNFANFEHWNHYFLIKTSILDLENLKQSINKLINIHDTFKISFKKNNNNWIQVYKDKKIDTDLKILNIKDLISCDESIDFNNELLNVLKDWQNSFNLEHGPLYSFGYIYGFNNNTARIFVAVHHLLIDTISWKIIQNDLFNLYYNNELLLKRTSYLKWAEKIKNYSSENFNEKKYWDDVLNNFKLINNYLMSYLLINKSKDINYCTVEFELSETRLILDKVNPIFNTTVQDLLISVMVSALYNITHAKEHYIMMEGNGRNEVDSTFDILDTIGWFSNMFPVKLEVKKTFAEQICYVKDYFKKVPNNGIGYGAFYSYSSKLSPKILFNYFGTIEQNKEIFNSQDNKWSLVQENSGRSFYSSKFKDFYICCNSLIFNQKLYVYFEGQIIKNSLNNFGVLFKKYLIDSINEIAKYDRKYLTLSDVDFFISQNYLNNIQFKNEIDYILPTTYLQSGLIYHSLNKQYDDCAYFNQISFNYEGNLNLEQLKIAWENTAKKHEIFRLRFAWDEEIIQIIDKNTKLDWRYIDISEKNILQKNQFIKNYKTKDRLEYFNLKNGKLIRICIIKQYKNLYTCLFSAHHSAIDGWSISILLSEVHDLYNKCEKIIKNKYDTVYSDTFKLISKEMDKNIDYWNNCIKTMENNLDLSCLFCNSAKNNKLYFANYRHIRTQKEKILNIDNSTFDNIKSLSVRYSVTINAIVFFAFCKLLSVYGNAEKMVIGTTVSGRNLPIFGVENVVGLLINTLPFYVNFAKKSNTKIIEIIKLLQDKINEMNEKSHGDFFKIYNGENRLFDVIFVYENYPMQFSNKIDESLSICFDEVYETLDYPLSAIVYKLENGIQFKIKYAGELFEDLIIDEMLEYFVGVLNKVVIYPEEMFKKVSFINTQQENLVRNLNISTDIDFTKCSSIIDLFENCVINYINNNALIFKDKIINYFELNCKSNQLANYIKINFNISKSHFIAIIQNRSDLMIISILAILKLGKAYLPIDPNTPKDRIDYILKDADPIIVLIDSYNIKEFNNCYNNFVNVNNVIDKISEYSSENISTSVAINDLAYLLYTSGTTGVPKGVAMPHESCLLRINKMASINKMSSKDVYLFKTNYIFDVSFSDIFTTLTSGASLVVTENHFDISEIEFLIKKHLVNICHFVPSQFKVFAELVNLFDLKSINRIVLSGEPLDIRLINKYLDSIRFINYYGPTETGEVTYKEFLINNLNHDLYFGRIFIGKLFGYLKAYVLDKNLHLLPINTVGELCISGSSLANYYWKNEDFTKQCFIDNPFITKQDDGKYLFRKMYKTGDLVRWLPNGELEYFGRIDFQVKLNGFRVELQEIENVISSYSGIKNSVVILSENNKFLVAYYLSDLLIDHNFLRNYVQAKLPTYMMPQYFLQIDALPLTANGKLDVAALPKIDKHNTVKFELPSNDIEIKLLDYWSEILNISKSKISINSSFFDLGGNSLFAIKLLNKINNNLSFDIKLSDIFVSKNIKNIALKITHQSKNYTPIVELNKKSSNPIMFMVHPARSGCEVYAKLAEHLQDHFYCLGVDSYNLNNNDKITSLNHLSDYYLKHIETYMLKCKQQNYYFLGWSLGGFICLEIASLLEIKGHRNINLFLLDSFYFDDYMNKNKMNLETFLKYGKQDFNFLGFDNSYIDKICTIYDIEDGFLSQKISCKLKFSNVTLLKALKFRKSGNLKNVNNYLNYSILLKDNNISNLLDDVSKLKIIDVPSATHLSIINEFDTIKTAIINSI